jgi:hypothetical protein
VILHSEEVVLLHNVEGEIKDLRFRMPFYNNNPNYIANNRILGLVVEKASGKDVLVEVYLNTAGDVVDVKKPPITYSFKVLQAIENRVGAKLVPEVMENVTPAAQYELLEMNRISGFVDRARGTGRPTKKDRRAMDEFVTPSFEADFDFYWDDEENEME